MIDSLGMLDAARALPEQMCAAAEGMDPVDRILDKIHRDGIGSLSAEERRIIEEASKNLRREGS
jgi:hypothetical protein